MEDHKEEKQEEHINDDEEWEDEEENVDNDMDMDLSLVELSNERFVLKKSKCFLSVSLTLF